MGRLILIALMLSLSACAKPEDQLAEKPLPAVWTRADRALAFDLTRAQNNTTQPMSLIFKDGTTCFCSFTASGTQSQGQYTIDFCDYDHGGSGDQSCDVFKSAGTYSNTGGILKFCDALGCTTFR